jgi:ABC-type sugar transport system ATPase subunit
MVTIGDQTVAAAPAHVSAARVRPWVGRTLSAGVRPEAFRLVDGQVAGAVTARVEDLEYLGHETLLYVRPERPAASDGGPVVARLPGMLAAAKGDIVHLQIDSRQVYLFDDTGRALVD